MPNANEHVEAKEMYEKALEAKINPPKIEDEPMEATEDTSKGKLI